MADWVILTLPPDWVRQGRVVVSKPPSMVVRWVGDDHDTVLPMAAAYLMNGQLQYVEPPGDIAEAPRKSGELLTVRQAAALLSMTPKQIRAMLRSGKLEGKQKDGRWLGVVSQAVYAVRKSRSDRRID